MFAVITWVPIAVWAWLDHRFLPGNVAEPLMVHFGVHARCLVAIPLFILADATAQGVGRALISYLLDEGIITDANRPRLHETLARAARLREGAVRWLIIAGIAIAWTLAGATIGHEHELLFAIDPGDTPPRLGFGALWFLYVARPVFVVLLLVWAWRLIIWTITLAKIARLDLSLVPTHA